MLNLQRLRLLRELEARGTVGAVARRLDYTPSAVSQQLRVLEEEAGTALVERAGRGLRLTDAGRVLARHAAMLLDGVEAAEAELATAGGAGLRATVRIAGFQSAIVQLATPALRELAGSEPGLRLEVFEEEFETALPELELQHLDLVIGDEYESVPRARPAALARDMLIRERVRLVLPATHPLAEDGAPVPLASLHAAAWASTIPGTGHRAMLVRACRAIGGFEPDIRHASNDLLILQALVATGHACALLPDLVLRFHAGADVAVRDIAEAAVGREVFVVTRRNRSPAVEAVLAALHRAAQEATGMEGRPSRRG
jgi:DNA-binding transcriptional LysR family regulator